ncbi:hypothetical protein NIIDNTM18_16070 [Mycolicibacterium litorale]|uniref:Uncharacterized protein n=1 Tax=Mycolicibacterium litorale TaxID=758802 RepID=A0A6S6P1H0_9MYCO|nr:hypothetical protein NIIDNTM18_16070 [Mycolicibacterium litorale]
MLRPHVDDDAFAGLRLFGGGHHLFPVFAADDDDRVGTGARITAPGGRVVGSRHQL